jgi:hypothetical protein
MCAEILMNICNEKEVLTKLVFVGVRIPAEAKNFSLHHRVQTGSGAHPASYPVGTRGSFPGGKVAEA